MSEETVISSDIFADNLHNLAIFPNNPKIAVAVSGGADSLCLAFLLKDFADKLGGHLSALIVDHHLREESALEARWVADLLTSRGINCVILDRKISASININTSIQIRAREDRYKLLFQYMKNNNIPYLCVGHHLDDQIETLLLRSDKGHNMVGDSGMSAKVIAEDAIILRPLLKYTKKQIINTILNYTPNWIEDVSNSNMKYARVRVREKLKLFDSIRKAELIEVIRKNGIKRLQLENDLVDLLSKCILINKFGLIKLNLILFDNYGREVKILALRRLIKFANGNKYEINIDKTSNLLSKLELGGIKKCSLGSCTIKVKSNFLLIFKVYNNPITTSIDNFSGLWDNRYKLDMKDKKSSDLIIKILGWQEYLGLLKEEGFKKYFENYDLKSDYLIAVPWLFDGKKQISWDGVKYIGFHYRVKDSLYSNHFCNNL